MIISKRHSLLILMAMLLLIMPMSFAEDAGDNQTADAVGISESVDSISIDDADVNSVESSGSDDRLSAGYDYETTVTPSTIDYTLGNSTKVNVQTKFDNYYQETLESYKFADGSYRFYAYIGDENSNPVNITIPMGFTFKNFQFDLAQISDKLSVGENKVYFHHSTDENVFYWFSDTKFNPLTVNVASSSYVTSPSPANVYFYNLGDSRNVNVSVDYDDSFDDALSSLPMYVYINGEEIRNRVAIDGVKANAKLFTIDLASISDKLVGGVNNLTFHPNLADLKDTVSGSYIFNTLKVSVQKPAEPDYDYISTPSPNSTNYTRGESLNVTVTIEYDEYALDIDYSNMCIYINGNTDAIKIEGVSAGAKSFTFDLAKISDRLANGKNTVVFHCPTALLDDATYGSGVYKFNPLSLNVKEEDVETTYEVNITNPASGTLNYIKGNESVKLSVKTNYDYRTMKALDNSKMYAFINGNETGVIVKNSFTGDDVRGSAMTFSFNLTQFDEYLTEKVNTIVFHPDESYYADANISSYSYQTLTVKLVDDLTPEDVIVYVSTPKVDGKDAIEYIIGENVTVAVTAEYVNVTNADGFEGKYMRIFINDNSRPIRDVYADSTNFTINLADYIDAEGQYNISFHPNIYALYRAFEGIDNAVYEFNNLTVTAKNASTPETTIKYESIPTVDGKDTAEYLLGEHKDVSIAIVSEKFNQFESYDKVYAYVDGVEKDVVAFANINPETVDLKTVSEAFGFEEGKTYVITFHPDVETLNQYGISIDEVKANNLTVTVTGTYTPEPKVVYNSTPKVGDKASVDYTIGDDLIVSVNVDYNESSLDASKLEYLNSSNMRIYINSDYVTIRDISSASKSFTVNLANYSDKLVEGENIISFHPRMGILETVFGTEDLFVFNNLTVNAHNAAEPIEPTYNVTADSPVEYTKGSEQKITVIIKFDDAYSNADLPVYVFFGQATQGTLVDGVKANDSSFEFDLMTISDKLGIGKNTISFHPDIADLIAVAEGEFNFTEITVNVKEAQEESSYVSTPQPNAVDYTIGNSLNITVNVAYDVYFNDYLSDLTMFVYINGEETANRVAIEGIKANETLFTFDLKTISDKLVNGTNNLTFHPHEGAIPFSGPYTFNSLTVNVNAGEEPSIEGNATYITTPQPADVDYTLGQSSIVNVDVEYDAKYSDEFGKSPIYAVINNNEFLEITGIKGNASGFTFDLKYISDYLAAGKNTVSFEIRDVNVKNLETIFNKLTVNAKEAPTDPNSTYVSTPTPSKVDYTLNESSIITVTIVYSDLFEERLPEEASMFVYINGEEIANRVKIEGVPGNATNFTFDLKTISDKLVNGTNNLTFHPHPGALEGIQVGPYTFNVLTVNVGTTPEPIAPPVLYTGVIYVDVNGNDNNSGSDDDPVCTIAKAIELASGDENTEHKIVIREGTYSESNLNVTSALDISGEGNAIIDANKTGRILNIDTSEAVNIRGITFKNGKANKGAAIAVKDAKITIDKSIFIGNDAASGAAILFDADACVLTNSLFTDNYGRNGVVKVGEYNWDTRKSSGSKTIIENCTFNNHTSVIYGNSMSIDIEEGTDGVTVIGCSFTNNIGQFGSEHGAVYIKGDNVVVDRCLFENNTMGMAAAIQIDGENAVIKNSKFVNNTVKQGIWTRSGAIELQNAAIITNNTFINNGGESCSQGGAIDVVYATFGGDIFISKNRFINNTAATGGAIFVDGGLEDGCKFDSITIEDNIFDGNQANHGSGIYTATSEEAIDILNNEFKNNKAINDTNILVESTVVNLEGNTMESGIIALVGYSDIGTDLTLTFTAPGEVLVGNAVNVTATLTDDMGNPITGPSVNFTANGINLANVYLVNGIAAIEFSPDKVGEYVISGFTELTADIKTATVKAIVNVTIEVDGVAGDAGSNVTVPIKVNVNGKPVDGTVNVTLNGKTVEAKLVNGTADVPITLPSESGDYDITVSYEGIEKTVSVSVNKVPEKSVSVITIDTVTDSTIIGKIMTVDGDPISNASVDYAINGKKNTTLTDGNGAFVIDVVGNEKVDIRYSGDESILPFNTSVTLKYLAPIRAATVIESSPYTTYAIDFYTGERGGYFKVQLLDDKGKALANKPVKIGFNGVVYDSTTDANGWAQLQINLMYAGVYTFAVAFLGDDDYNASFVVQKITVMKKKTTITAAAKSFKASAKTKSYTVTLKTDKGSSINGIHMAAGKKVTMKVNGKTYSIKTNSKGQATFKIGITKKGKFSARIKFAGDNTYLASSKTVKITIR